jgi:hypothetical protein
MRFLSSTKTARNSKDVQAKKLVEQAQLLLQEAKDSNSALKLMEAGDPRREELEREIRSRLQRSRELAKIAKEIAAE